MRHRVRAIQLKHRKRGNTTYKALLAKGAKPEVARQIAVNSRRWWRNSGMLLNSVLTLRWMDALRIPRLA
jgi:RNA-directed DNA polymerase